MPRKSCKAARRTWSASGGRYCSTRSGSVMPPGKWEWNAISRPGPNPMAGGSTNGRAPWPRTARIRWGLSGFPNPHEAGRRSGMNWGEDLAATRLRYGDNPGVFDAESRHTIAQVIDRAAGIADRLRDLGLGPND